MTHLRLALVLCLTLAAGCAAPAPVITRDPPPPVDEQPTRKPASHVFWKSGHWTWDEQNQQYFWETGAWEAERDGMLWIPGYWTRVEEQGVVEGWTWVEPRWEELPDTPR